MAEALARSLVHRLIAGETSCEELVSHCLEQARTHEPRVQAFAFLDPEHALAQARLADDRRKAGLRCGPLFGVPVGVKDIFDTADMPTEDGTVLHAGRRPRTDSHAVRRLREAGAIIFGKTVTTECAYYSPGVTRNPHDPSRTPGGSSSGSAAAVAAGMVPLAIGSQTNGSMLRPASFCGVWGFKPTHGLVSRTGVLTLSRSLDHVGVFATHVEDVALALDALAGFDPADPDTRLQAHPALLDTCVAEPPLPPTLAFVRGPFWSRAEAAMQAGIEEVAASLGDRCHEQSLPNGSDAMADWARTIMAVEMRFNLRQEFEHGRERLSDRLRELLDHGGRVTALEYQIALLAARTLRATLEEMLAEYDAILMPAACGVAPAGLDSTGDPIFNTLASLTGLPAVSMPMLADDDGLPMGVQLIGAAGQDGRLLRTARALAAELG